MSNTGTILRARKDTPAAQPWLAVTIGQSAPGSVPQAVAIDGGETLGAAFIGKMAEFIGVATPVVTPFSLGVKNGTLGSRPEANDLVPIRSPMADC